MPPQISRLVLLTMLIMVSYAGARYCLTPASFHQYGWYRGAALEVIASREPVFSGKKSCNECHSDILQKQAKGPHKTLSCETCHGLSKEHAENPDLTPQTPLKLSGSLCMRCHEANPSRPAWFKQVTVKEHYSGKCTECHVPHQPLEVP